MCWSPTTPTLAPDRRGSPVSSGRPSVGASDDEFVLPAIELYEVERLDFADAYVCAVAELLVWSRCLLRPPASSGLPASDGSGLIHEYYREAA